MTTSPSIRIYVVILMCRTRALILREKQFLYFLENTKDLRLSILCMKIMKLTIKERFPPWDTLFFQFLYHKITLFEKKYYIKLITFISVYHLKPLVSLGRFMKNQNADIQIVFGSDVFVTTHLLHSYFFIRSSCFPIREANRCIEIYPAIIALRCGLNALFQAIFH